VQSEADNRSVSFFAAVFGMPVSPVLVKQRTRSVSMNGCGFDMPESRALFEQRCGHDYYGTSYSSLMFFFLRGMRSRISFHLSPTQPG